MKSVTFQKLTLYSLAICLTGFVGCSEETQQAAQETLSSAEDDAAKMAEQTGEKASEMGEKAKDAMANLSEEAMGFLKPITEQLLSNFSTTRQKRKKATNNPNLQKVNSDTQVRSREQKKRQL